MADIISEYEEKLPSKIIDEVRNNLPKGVSETKLKKIMEAKLAGKEPYLRHMEEQAALAVFQGKKIRRLWYNDQWWFSIVDVVGALSESEDSRNYWKVLKHRLKD